MIRVEGNKGGDYLHIAKTTNEGEIFLDVGHSCVVAFRGLIPVEILTALIGNAQLGVNLPWDEEINARLVSRVKQRDFTYEDADQDMHDIAVQAIKFLSAGTAKKRFKEQQRLVRIWSRMEKKREKRMKITNRVTKAQLALKPGDMVDVTLDDGTKQCMSVKHEPTKVGGTWVAWLNEISGCYALCRCKPLKVQPATELPPLFKRIADTPSSWEAVDE